MAIEIRLAVLAALAVVFAGAAPTLSALDGNAGVQSGGRQVAVYNSGEQAGKEKDVEAMITERQEADVNKQKETELRIGPQISQLQFLYTYYIWMEICAERFNEFASIKSGLKRVVRSKEADFTLEQTDSIWNVTAEKFQQVEVVLQIAGEAQLYADCDQNGRYVEGLLMLASRMGGPQPLPRKKDF